MKDGPVKKKSEIKDRETPLEQWRQAYRDQVGQQEPIHNRSGIEIRPLYSHEDWGDPEDIERLGYPGQPGYARGIYASMHRGRTWSQRQLVGFGTPKNYNERLHALSARGINAANLVPCNSVFRGYDADDVDPLLLGTCGTVVNTIDDIDLCFKEIPLEEYSVGLNDPSPFTLLALMIGAADRRGIPLKSLSGTSNQSDYISHFVANHMFFRLALDGARRVLVDHIEYCLEHIPNWNPLSVVGQHMQQAGATPAETMGFTLSSAIQYAEDCRERGLDPAVFLPRFTYFFDISISFFEEIAKFRAGRRVWSRVVKERFGVDDPRARRLKFHAQTSGVDLTQQQPLNNITRVAIQAMAGIFGGLQSLHTDAYDEAISTPSADAAKIAINTQNILREEAHLCDVIDPLGGSYYLESLTDEMEAKIEDVIGIIDEAGGMFRAVKSGLVQSMIGESAREFQEQVDAGRQTVVGVNAYRDDEESVQPFHQQRPTEADISEYLEELARYKAKRDTRAVERGLSALARAANSKDENIYGRVVEAAKSGATHGEIVKCLREELGFGDPLVVP